MTESRTNWPTPPREALAEELRAAASEALAFWVEQYEFIQAEFGPPAHMLLFGGIPAMFALNDMRWSYVFGNYLAVVLTAQVFAEQTLGGEYRLRGNDKTAASGFSRLINAALKDGVIEAGTAERLHALRRMRNPYSHSSPVGSDRGYMARLRVNALSPEDLAAKDARDAIQAVVDLLRDGSPSWRPPSPPSNAA